MFTIDWPAFTPYSAVAGGVLIGAAAGALALGGGKIAGISGILLIRHDEVFMLRT